jgi:dihydrofolate reductase
MFPIEAIVAVDKNYGMAKNGLMPWKSKTDMNFFKITTTNNIIVMGSKTLLSLKNALPLPNRLNIILTRNHNRFIDDPKYKDLDNIIFLDEEMFTIFVNNPNVLIKAEHYKYLNKNAKIFIIGGEQIYSKYCNICSTIWLTKIKADYECDLILKNEILDYFNMNSVEYKDDELEIIKLTKQYKIIN